MFHQLYIGQGLRVIAKGMSSNCRRESLCERYAGIEVERRRVGISSAMTLYKGQGPKVNARGVATIVLGEEFV